MVDENWSADGSSANLMGYPVGTLSEPSEGGFSKRSSADSEFPVNNDPARDFREAIERHILSAQISRDGYQVKQARPFFPSLPPQDT